eukprot:TRINITY_DN888_c0_g1_i2.p1 TRINITY_DN888_c0_g1~~TRINITY_DN888_c0_g1_i2.p1  ORF type:complete len:266 (-),score=30.52 TRINITY_DN888_c0_g1_i2:43-813(-)
MRDTKRQGSDDTLPPGQKAKHSPLQEDCRTEYQLTDETISEQLKELRALAKEMVTLGFNRASSGNVSLCVRREAKSFMVITASGTRGDQINSISDLTWVDLQSGAHIMGGKGSSETGMHRQVYLHNENANFVAHSHPPQSIALTIKHKELLYLHAHMGLFGGQIPIAPYCLFGTPALAESIKGCKHGACLLRFHGLITHGRTAQEAVDRSVEVEHMCKIQLLLNLNADYDRFSLEDADVEELHEVLKSKGLFPEGL